MATLISDVTEIDLYDCLLQDPFRHFGQIRAYIPYPYNQTVYLSLSNTKQRYGRRTWFLCSHCGKRVSKLYVIGGNIACRHCFGLKYDSQYRKDPLSRMSVKERKLARYESQKRRFWYAGSLTQFGKRYYKHREDMEAINQEVIEYFQKMDSKLYSGKREATSRIA